MQGVKYHGPSGTMEDDSVGHHHPPQMQATQQRPSQRTFFPQGNRQRHRRQELFAWCFVSVLALDVLLLHFQILSIMKFVILRCCLVVSLLAAQILSAMPVRLPSSATPTTAILLSAAEPNTPFPMELISTAKLSFIREELSSTELKTVAVYITTSDAGEDLVHFHRFSSSLGDDSDDGDDASKLRVSMGIATTSTSEGIESLSDDHAVMKLSSSSSPSQTRACCAVRVESGADQIAVNGAKTALIQMSLSDDNDYDARHTLLICHSNVGHSHEEEVALVRNEIGAGAAAAAAASRFHSGCFCRPHYFAHIYSFGFRGCCHSFCRMFHSTSLCCTYISSQRACE